MKDLDFNPLKSQEAFRKNYALHDYAEYHGKNLLTMWGIKFNDFGGDKRFEKVWEKGDDRPDTIISYKDKSVLLDWKGKRKAKWIVNERAVTSYEKWSKDLNIPVIIVFFVLSDEGYSLERRFAYINKHKYIVSSGRQWDKNKTVEFPKDIPEFTKGNLLSLILEK